MARNHGRAGIIAVAVVVVVAAVAIAWALSQGALGGAGLGSAFAGAQPEKAKLSLQYVYPSLDKAKVLNSGTVNATGVFVAIDGSRVAITKAECFEVASGSLSERIVSCPNFGNDLSPGQSKIFTLAQKIGAGKTIELGCDACEETGTQLSQKVHVLQ